MTLFVRNVADLASLVHTELEEVLFPDSQLPVLSLCYTHDATHLVDTTHPVRICEVLLLVQFDDSPNVQSSFADFHLQSFILTIVQEVSIFARVDFFG